MRQYGGRSGIAVLPSSIVTPAYSSASTNIPSREDGGALSRSTRCNCLTPSMTMLSSSFDGRGALAHKRATANCAVASAYEVNWNDLRFGKHARLTQLALTEAVLGAIAPPLAYFVEFNCGSAKGAGRRTGPL